MKKISTFSPRPMFHCSTGHRMNLMMTDHASTLTGVDIERSRSTELTSEKEERPRCAGQIGWIAQRRTNQTLTSRVHFSKLEADHVWRTSSDGIVQCRKQNVCVFQNSVDLKMSSLCGAVTVAAGHANGEGKDENQAFKIVRKMWSRLRAVDGGPRRHQLKTGRRA